MIFLLEKVKVAFVGVPKCMTTTFSMTFYEWEFGKPYIMGENEGKFSQGYWKDRAAEAGVVHKPPSFDKLDGYETFTVVRDPVARCLSAYANKVVGEKVIEKAAATPWWQGRFGHLADKFVPVPSEDFFFENIKRYRRLNKSVRHHTDHFSEFLGDDLSRFDHVFKIEQVDKIQAFVSDRLGREITLPRHQGSGEKPKQENLSKAARSALLDFLQPDYELLKDYYQPVS